jgi:uncharacterized membrane protein
MASQKRSRSGSGRAKPAASAGPRSPGPGSPGPGSPGPGSAGPGSAGTRTETVAPPGSAGSKGRNGTPQAASRNARNQGARGQGGRGQGGRGQGGRGQGGRGQEGRGQEGRGRGGQTGAGRPASAQARSGTATIDLTEARRAVGRPSPSRWFQLTTFVLSLAGLGVSIYLTIVHYASPKLLVCSDKGAINCEKVITSPESMVFGVLPVAVLGLAFYVFMVAINSPWAWRSRLPLLWWARVAAAVTGIGFVLYLLYAEIVEIGNICLWCTSVHVITFLLFVLIIFFATLGGGATTRDTR